MTILYALVARGKTVLSEFTFTSGNFPTITRLLLGRIDMARSGKMSYIYDQYVFHYVCEEGLLYLCMCDDPDSQKRRVPFAFLEDVKRRFLAAYGDVAQTAIAFAMNLEFSRVLQQQMELFNGPMGDRQQFSAVHQKLDDVKNRFFATYGDKGQAAIAFAYNEDFGRTIQKQLEFYNGPQADQFATVHKKLDDVKNVMVQNIEMVLERGEKLELLVDKSEQLQLDSFRFQKSSKKLRQAMFWKKVKIYMLIACVVLVLLYIFLAVLCGPTFEKCGNKDKK